MSIGKAYDAQESDGSDEEQRGRSRFPGRTTTTNPNAAAANTGRPLGYEGFLTASGITPRPSDPAAAPPPPGFGAPVRGPGGPVRGPAGYRGLSDSYVAAPGAASPSSSVSHPRARTTTITISAAAAAVPLPRSFPIPIIEAEPRHGLPVRRRTRDDDDDDERDDSPGDGFGRPP
ncbi:hypothetical protein CkaCkLH20_06044 [Colletotrichum karsti]|uniref:Uncharacterized protein n=1 Tax=Colletotrichum karsti TaxID=1095194 RepID=A0A9P6I9V8_9PEZI|nr:uncharacterized protein CkaCkLH20_06044 [Colletotrichum karsti]KAF9876636.1 hypothetical protein CkaCkLH20_06044 [Colletotrichum karsti]